MADFVVVMKYQKPPSVTEKITAANRQEAVEVAKMKSVRDGNGVPKKIMVYKN